MAEGKGLLEVRSNELQESARQVGEKGGVKTQ